MPGIVATGGVITTVGADTVHTFNATGAPFQVTSGSGNVRYLVVAGGGAGAGSGGGAGGMRDSGTATYAVTVGSYAVTVGAAVTGPANGSNTAGSVGNNSVFDTITSLGGGGGAPNNTNGSTGGSGSGGGREAGATHTGGAGTAGQGSNGGNSGTALTPFPAGGGGGAGAVGGAGADIGVAGNGGDGLSSDISGTPTVYAGGGGGGVQLAGGMGGTGGNGGGGNGSASGAGSPGAANTGGGGGGCRAANAGGNGGSGIVIIRYATATPDVIVDTPIIGGGYHPSQGNLHPYSGHEVRQRSKESVRQERERLGIIAPQAVAVIEDVAARQAERLEQDEQKRFEELSRELELQGIAWDTRYLEALNAYRDFLISEEIAARLQANILEADMFWLVTVAATA